MAGRWGAPLLLLHAAGLSAATQQVALELDSAAASRTFDGHGALSAGASSRLLLDYPEPQRSQILDTLFLPGFAASLHILKVEIPGDHQSTDGTEPSHMHTRGDLSCTRGYELWLVSEAKRRNPNILVYAMAWTAPGWVGGPNGTLYSDDGIEYLVSWMHCALEVTGYAPNLAGLWNEQVQPKPEWVKALRGALDRTPALRATQLIVMDGPHFDDAELQEAAADPDYRSAVLGAGLHYPCWRDQSLWANQSSLVDTVGWKFWASEDNSKTPEWSTGGTYLGKALNQNFVAMNLTSTISWSLIWAEYDNLICTGAGLMRANEPWSGHYQVDYPIWMLAHTTHFAQPGWRFLSVSSGSSGFIPGTSGSPAGTYVSLVPPECTSSDSCGAVTLVLETLKNDECLARKYEDLDIKVSLRNFKSIVPGTKLHVRRTTKDSTFERLPDAVVDEAASFTVSLPADSIITISTVASAAQGLNSSVPESQPFPVPYGDAFDDYKLDGVARFFSDQGGSWAVRNGVFLNVADGGARNNSCLPEWDPVTVLGHYSLADYAVATDVSFKLDPQSDGGAADRNVLEALAAAPLPGRREAVQRSSPSSELRWRSWSGREAGLEQQPEGLQGSRRPARNTSWVALEAAAAASGDPTADYGRVCGRITNFPGFNWHHTAMPGYCLLLTAAGGWSLTRNETVASSGLVPHFDASAPHRLVLSMKGPSIRALIDGDLLASLQDSNFTQGSIALGSSYGGAVAFDNMAITPPEVAEPLSITV